ncbi:MAG: hypothetical protein AB1791_08105 [Chloroflexota bacterium]
MIRLTLLLGIMLWRAWATTELTEFTATSVEGGIALAWTTAAEVHTAGFRLKRSLAFIGPYEVITVNLDGEGVELVPAAGVSGSGANYQVVDEAVTDGQLYWYILVEVESGGTEVELNEPLSVLAGATPTPTPLVIVTSALSTSTAVPTSTRPASPTPTVTGTAVVSSTATATGSPAPSETPTPTPLPTETATIGPRINTFPTPTRFAFPPGSQPQAVAQVPATTVAPAAYPGPATAIPSAPVVGNDPSTPPTAVLPAVEPTIDWWSSLAPSETLGESPDAVTTIALEQQTDPAESRSAPLFLWGGCFAALLILLAGVFGSILVFTRPAGRRS